MSITLYESHLSRDMDGGNPVVRYVVTGTTSPVEARQAVLLDTPPVLFDRIRKEPQLTFEGGDLYRVEVPYGMGEPGDAVQPDGQDGGENSGGPSGGGDGGPGEGGEGEPGGPGGGAPPGDDDPLGFNVTFDTGGGTAHILLSKETLFKARVGGNPKDYERAIGVAEGAGTVEGCDIVTAGGEFSVTRKRRTVTQRYLRDLLRITGSTNKQTFWQFPAGELLYLGASGQGSNGKGWTITHKFRFAENIPPGPGDSRNVITPNLVITQVRPGHSYVWCTYAEKDEAGSVVIQPNQVYMERVYPEENFTALQIGT